jgi:hypothetical protein
VSYIRAATGQPFDFSTLHCHVEYKWITLTYSGLAQAVHIGYNGLTAVKYEQRPVQIPVGVREGAFQAESPEFSTAGDSCVLGPLDSTLPDP